jgi:hypothetical protein
VSRLKWGYDPIEARFRETDEERGSRVPSPYTRRSMSSTQMIIVTVLSLAVVALLMVRQRQTN